MVANSPNASWRRSAERQRSFDVLLLKFLSLSASRPAAAFRRYSGCVQPGMNCRSPRTQRPAVKCCIRDIPEKSSRGAISRYADRGRSGSNQHGAVLQRLPMECARLFFHPPAASSVSDAERSLESTREAFGADQSKLTPLIFVDMPPTNPMPWAHCFRRSG
jgi:hypothetical protein